MLLRTLARTHLRTLGPSHLRTIAPSHLRTIAPSHLRTVVAVLAALLVMPHAAAASADPGVMDNVHVTVRTYDITSLPSETRQAALATATEILRGAGVSVSWMACDAVFVRRAGDACLAPLGTPE